METDASAGQAARLLPIGVGAHPQVGTSPLLVFSVSPYPLSQRVCDRRQKWSQFSALPNIPTLCHPPVSFTLSLLTILDSRMLVSVTQAAT